MAGRLGEAGASRGRTLLEAPAHAAGREGGIELPRAHEPAAILWGAFGTEGARRLRVLRGPRAELRVHLHAPPDPRHPPAGDLLDRLETFARDLRPDEIAFALLGYDLKNAIERLPAPTEPVVGIPDLFAAAYGAVAEAEEDAPLRPRHGDGFRCGAAAPLMTREAYVEAVRRALEEIARGEIYQINLAQRFAFPFEGDPVAAFLALRRHDPAPFSAYLHAGGFAMLSITPERLLARWGDVVETAPIKGTRPRSGDRARDRTRLAELAASGKERAELAMITDLHRNDLGRVCRFGSVRVLRRRRFTRLAHVFHTHAEIRGILRPDGGIATILRAMFPGGSVTGCPKIRAMELIHELEPRARGPYTGAFGPIWPGGDFDWAMTIRTVFLDLEAGRGWFDVGSGIVADSDPVREYEETLHKAESLLQTLAPAGGGAVRE